MEELLVPLCMVLCGPPSWLLGIAVGGSVEGLEDARRLLRTLRLVTAISSSITVAGCLLLYMALYYRSPSTIPLSEFTSYLYNQIRSLAVFAAGTVISTFINTAPSVVLTVMFSSLRQRPPELHKTL